MYLFIYNIVCEYLFQKIIYKQGMCSLFIHSMWGAFYQVARNNIYNCGGPFLVESSWAASYGIGPKYSE